MAVPWEENPEQWKALLDQARQASESGSLTEAAGLYRQAYDLEPTAFVASRYLHCMRRQGPEKARAAVRFARTPVERWPLDTWLIREYCWAIYDGYLRQSSEVEEEAEEPAETGAEFELKVKAARRILKLCHEDLPRVRTVFAICREAKARGLWALALEFAQALDPAKLSEEVRQYQGRPVPSDRQRWLSIVTRACLELERYDDALRHAREGMEQYPHVLFYPWWHALALIRQGRVQAGVRELEEVHRHFVAPWYIPRDIADAYELLEQHETAWRWYCAAAMSSGDLKSRIPMLARMAEPLQRLDRWPLAFDHLLLAWSLAAREPGWEKLTERLREQVETFLQKHTARLGSRAALSDSPPAPEPLLTTCREAWRAARR
jgi:tetratricopeptide (TPR) repeat protein